MKHLRRVIRSHALAAAALLFGAGVAMAQPDRNALTRLIRERASPIPSIAEASHPVAARLMLRDAASAVSLARKGVAAAERAGRWAMTERLWLAAALAEAGRGQEVQAALAPLLDASMAAPTEPGRTSALVLLVLAGIAADDAAQATQQLERLVAILPNSLTTPLIGHLAAMVAGMRGPDAVRQAMRSVVFPAIGDIAVDPLAMFPAGADWDPVRMTAIRAMRGRYGTLWDPLDARIRERRVYGQFVDRLVSAWRPGVAPQEIWRHVEMLISKSSMHGHHQLTVLFVEAFLTWHGRQIDGTELQRQVLGQLARARLRDGSAAGSAAIFDQLSRRVDASAGLTAGDRAFGHYALASEYDIPETPRPAIAAFRDVQRHIAALGPESSWGRVLQFNALLRLLWLNERAEDRWSFSEVLAEAEPLAATLESNPPHGDGTRFHTSYLRLAMARALLSLGRGQAALSVAEAAAQPLDAEVPLRALPIEKFDVIRQLLDRGVPAETFQRRQSAVDLLGQYFLLAGRAAMSYGEWPRALALLERARHHSLITTSVCSGEEQNALFLDLSRAYRLAGQTDEADAAQQEFMNCSVNMAESSEQRGVGVLLLAETLEAAGDLYHAEYAARRGLAMLVARRGAPEREILRGRVLLTRLALQSGRRDLAAQEAEEALRAIEGRDRSHFGEAEFRSLDSLVEAFVDHAAADRRMLDLAYRALQARRNNHAQAAAEIAADRATAALQEGADIARRLAGLRYDLRSVEHDFRALAFTERAADVAARRNGLEAERAEIEASIAALGERFPATLRDPFATTVSAITPQALRDGIGEAVLDYAVTSRHAYLTVMTPQGVEGPHRLATTPEQLGALVDSVRAGLGTEARSAFDSGAAADLYDSLIRPIAARIADARRIYLIADDPLARLPFHLLIADRSAAEAAPNSRHAGWWIGPGRSVVTLPGPRLLLQPRTGALPGPVRTPGGRVLAVTPYASAEQPAGRIFDLSPASGRSAAVTRGAPVAAVGTTLRARLAALKPLHHAAEEVRAIAATFGSRATTLTQADATERRLRTLDLSDYRMVFIAAHAVPPQPDAGQDEPGLVLFLPAEASEQDDGLLTPSEIAQLNLDADIVVLSACDTSLGRAGDPQTLNGLARGFLAAGARAVIVSHWPVDSATAATLVSGMAAALANGLDASDALTGAMLALRERGRHPSEWAPFVVVSGGRVGAR